MELNYDVIKERADELTYFPEWIPFTFWYFINMKERVTFLRTMDLFEVVQKKNEYYKYKLFDNPELEDSIIQDFITSNPQFKDFIK